MNWIQDMNKLTGPEAPLRLPAAVEVRGMLANGVQILLAVRGVYELRDGKTGVYVTMPDDERAPLDDAQALELARKHLDKGLSWAPHITRCTDLEIRALIRAVEAAHGITGPNVELSGHQRPARKDEL
jgi:hypothetical protein